MLGQAHVCQIQNSPSRSWRLPRNSSLLARRGLRGAPGARAWLLLLLESKTPAASVSPAPGVVLVQGVSGVWPGLGSGVALPDGIGNGTWPWGGHGVTGAVRLHLGDVARTPLWEQ